jgi:hypothetical protein
VRTYPRRISLSSLVPLSESATGEVTTGRIPAGAYVARFEQLPVSSITSHEGRCTGWLARGFSNGTYLSIAGGSQRLQARTRPAIRTRRCGHRGAGCGSPQAAGHHVLVIDSVTNGSLHSSGKHIEPSSKTSFLVHLLGLTGVAGGERWWIPWRRCCGLGDCNRHRCTGCPLPRAPAECAPPATSTT